MGTLTTVQPEHSLSKRVAATSALLVIRRGLITVVSGASTIVVARAPSSGDYGILQGALATWTPLGGPVDFGIGLSLNQDLPLQNASALVLNVASYLALAPKFGVYVAAWITVATELFTVVLSAWAARCRSGLSVSWRTIGAPFCLFAGALLSCWWLPIPDLTRIGLAAFVYVVVIILAGQWRDKFFLGRRCTGVHRRRKGGDHLRKGGE